MLLFFFFSAVFNECNKRKLRTPVSYSSSALARFKSVVIKSKFEKNEIG